jgi:hypothetical protein
MTQSFQVPSSDPRLQRIEHQLDLDDPAFVDGIRHQVPREPREYRRRRHRRAAAASVAVGLFVMWFVGPLIALVLATVCYFVILVVGIQIADRAHPSPGTPDVWYGLGGLYGPRFPG